MKNISFIDFVKSQPSNREIHSHADWKSCAVGDYFREVLEQPVPDYLYWSRVDEYKGAVVVDGTSLLLSEHPEIGINKAQHFYLNNGTEIEAHTYGELLEALLDWNSL